MLGVVTALRAEGECLLSGLTLKPLVVTPFGGKDVVLVSGLGPACAKDAAQKLLAHGATALLSWGTAGGLSPSSSPGMLLVPATVTDGRTKFSVDHQWQKWLTGRLQGHIAVDASASILSADNVIATPQEKQALWKDTAATAVDMESASIAEAADKAGVPFLAIRAIVDPAAFALPLAVTESTDMFGDPKWMALAGRLVQTPSALIELVRLARFFQKATTTLRTVAHVMDRSLRYSTHVQ